MVAVRWVLALALALLGPVGPSTWRAVAQDTIRGRLQLVPAQQLKREVPDTRYLSRVLWMAQVLDSLAALELRSDSSGLEEGLCIYGGWYDDGHTLVVHYALPPTEIANQTVQSISISCTVTPQFIGIAHTHTTPLAPDDLRGDAYLLRLSDYALLSVAVHGGYLAWVSREAESTPWRYRP